MRQTKVNMLVTQRMVWIWMSIPYLVQDDGYINGKLGTKVYQDLVINSLFLI